jgi:homoserine dehydrogenase
VVPGFYGRGPDGKIYLLGRGGSDLTALHLAHSLGAACRLLKDVDGVYDADPGHPTRSARRYAQLSYEDALRLQARWSGEGLLHPRRAILFEGRRRGPSAHRIRRSRPVWRRPATL